MCYYLFSINDWLLERNFKEESSLNTSENGGVVEVFKSMWAESGPTWGKRLINFLIVIAFVLFLGSIESLVSGFLKIFGM